MDESIPPPERQGVFEKWVSGYYTHGSEPATLERRTPDASPRPSIANFTPEDLKTTFHGDVGVLNLDDIIEMLKKNCKYFLVT